MGSGPRERGLWNHLHPGRVEVSLSPPSLRQHMPPFQTAASCWILIPFAPISCLTIPSSLSPPKKSLMPTSVVLTQYSSLVDRYIIVLNHSCILDLHLPSTSCKPRENEMLCYVRSIYFICARLSGLVSLFRAQVLRMTFEPTSKSGLVSRVSDVRVDTFSRSSFVNRKYIRNKTVSE